MNTSGITEYGHPPGIFLLEKKASLPLYHQKNRKEGTEGKNIKILSLLSVVLVVVLVEFGWCTT